MLTYLYQLERGGVPRVLLPDLEDDHFRLEVLWMKRDQLDFLELIRDNRLIRHVERWHSGYLVCDHPKSKQVRLRHNFNAERQDLVFVK